MESMVIGRQTQHNIARLPSCCLKNCPNLTAVGGKGRRVVEGVLNPGASRREG